MKKINFLILLIVSIILVSCYPYRKDEIVFEYPEYNALYYVKSSIINYKYSDYIIDDISNGLYKKSTPNIADYKNGNGEYDYDIVAYKDASLDYAIKNELIKNHEEEIRDICRKVNDAYFEQKNSYVYFYDKGKKKEVLLSEEPVTNIAYDDEIPVITFDTEPIVDSEERLSIKGKKMYLSDIIASNTTIDGYMKIILATGMEKHKFFLDKNMPIE